ncbi:hypothetical protein QVD17_07074 [Tagetes erecta]|uniref:Uncharacterized protein n=1 Tax=Tagetes erecta TaxID=13708 RepID=A0AAD8LLH0_TARER|nr:hypothetical protein QVD17_07074 [Tagetes erecta]
MGDSNVESSNLARKLLKIDGNPRVNLLRGSSKGNDAPKTTPSSRQPVRGAAVYPARVDAHPARVGAHPANGSLHTADDRGHSATGSVHPVDISAYPANDNDHPADGNVHTATGSVYPADVSTYPADVSVHPADVGVHPADVSVHPADGNVHTANGLGDTANVHTGDKLIDQESELLASFRVASVDEERFLKQKSKVDWLAEGDANTRYFHNTLKCRNHRARIDVITDSNGILHEGKEVPKAFVDHYVGFLGKEEAVIIPIT